MLTLLINLDRSPDRLASMRAQGLKFERIPAIYGTDLPASMRPEFLDSSGAIASKLIPGEVGCYASHMLCWERLIADGLFCALVLEDDVSVDPRIMEVAASAIRNAPMGWDIIHLCDSNKKRLIPIASLDGSHTLVRYTRLPINACGYIISQSGARKMRKPGSRVRPVDVELRHGYLRGMDIYGVSPSIVANGPLDDDSSIIGRTQERLHVNGRQWRPSIPERAWGRLYNWRKAVVSLGQTRLSVARSSAALIWSRMRPQSTTTG